MKKTVVFVLVGAAAVLLTGCYGYGPHMGWDDHGSHMRSYRSDGYPSAPCNPDGRRDSNGVPCRSNP